MTVTRKPSFVSIQPFGKLTGFQPNMLDLAAPMPDEARYAARITRGFAFLDDDAALIDDADTGGLQ
jgi:hypothetical protein